MFGNITYRGRDLRITVGITMLALLLTGGVNALSSSGGALIDYKTLSLSHAGAGIVRADIRSPDVSQYTGLSDPLQMPGRLEANGTHFELTNSSYLNITLDSSEPVNLTLESAPEMITMHVESASGATSTQITLSGFAPQNTYHKYEDNYHNHTAFTSDAGGNYTYTQNLSRAHLIFIQPRPSTKFINDNATGGDCNLIGTWNATTKTCALTNDLNETIQIDSDDITINGSGYTITGSGTGSGVYLSGRTGIIIKNLNIEKFYNGIYMYYSNNNTLSGNNASDNNYGIYLWGSSNNNTLNSNYVSNNSYWGIYLDRSSFNILSSNNASNNYYGIYLYLSSNNNALSGNYVSNNKYWGIYLYHTSSNTLSDNYASNNSWGIFLEFSSSNNLSSNYASNNNVYGICLVDSINNTLNGNYASNNNNYGINLYYSNSNTLISNAGSISLDSSSNNILNGNNALNNGGNGIYLTDSSSNTLSSNYASNNNGDGIYLDRSGSNTISDNNALNNGGNGISLGSYSNNNMLSGNYASNNNAGGIYIVGSSNMLSSNNASNNGGDGISLIDSSNNILSGNNASSNHYGISLISYSGSYSNNNTLSSNYASNNNAGGINMYSSSNNSIYNNFFNNTDNFLISDTVNKWNITQTQGTSITGDLNLGGNFWASPNGTGFGQTCVDMDMNGICDSAYVLDANNTDYLPLAAPVISGNYQIHIPWTATTQGWATPYVIANKGNNNASINISYYNQADGSYVGNYSINIPSGASKLVFREWTTSNTDGSAVLISDQPVTVMVDQFNNGQNNFGAYEVDQSGSSEVFLPLTSTTDGWTTPYVIVNRGTANATVNITYYYLNGSIAGNYSVEILPSASRFVFREWAVGGDGAAKLSSDQPISVLVDMFKNAENKFEGYTPAPFADTQVFIPWTATTQGWSTPYKIVNRGSSSAVVNITYYNQADGMPVGNDSVSIAPNETVTLFRENSTANSTDGSTVLNSTQPVSVVVEQFNQGKFGVYTPSMTASSTVVIPWTATTQGWTTPYVIVNRGNASASVNISYYNQVDGSYAGSYSVNISPGTSKFVFREWTTSNTDGSAVLVSDQPVTVMVDQFNNGQNRFGAYTPIG